mmetsp:Transcript_43324/g.85822  ORF Transcript_43324/g.85822 Transcript_43324/m.85822 type:complete len:264 (-) Transcript_43324:365-1156(-)
MGAQCCGQRRPARMSEFNMRPTLTTIGGTHPDVKNFDAALEQLDINALAVLLRSKCPIAKIEDPLHPWALNPTTIGALAAVQLAIMANSEEAQFKIGEAGAIELLLEFLESEQEDRRHCGMVALHTLLFDNPENVSLAVDAGAIDILMNHIDVPLPEARMLIGNTLRHIFVTDPVYRKEFVMKGGITFFVNQVLFAVENPDIPNAQFDAVVNMLDLLQEDDGQAIPELVLQVPAIIKTQVRYMQTESDDELSKCVLELLEMID